MVDLGAVSLGQILETKDKLGDFRQVKNIGKIILYLFIAVSLSPTLYYKLFIGGLSAIRCSLCCRLKLRGWSRHNSGWFQPK